MAIKILQMKLNNQRNTPDSKSPLWNDQGDNQQPQLAWLARAKTEANRPTVLVTHHNPSLKTK